MPSAEEASEELELLLEATSAIRGELESKFPDFPDRQCKIATRFLMSRLGCRACCGYYSTPYGDVEHFIGYYPLLDVYIDLTADQFDKTNPKVLIFKKEDAPAQYSIDTIIMM